MTGVKIGDTGKRLQQLTELPQGRFVFREGDLGGDMYVIHDGNVEVLQQIGDGLTVLGVLQKGDTFGELSILDNLPRAVSIRTLTAVKLIRVDGATLQSMLRDNPEMAQRLLRGIASRARTAHRLVSGIRPEAVEELGKRATGQTVPVGTSRLVHDETETLFIVALDRITTIGRRDAASGIRPEVDLGALDPDRTTSRQHARIIPEQGRFLLVEESSAANGTFLNGTRVEAGIPVEVRSGDALRFGLVECSFRTD